AASLSFSILLLTSPRALGPPPFPYTTLFRSRGGTTGRLPTPRLWHGGWVWLGPGHPRPRQVPNPRCRATVPERSGPPWSVRVLPGPAPRTVDPGRFFRSSRRPDR